jgi:hypothetical protein
VEDSNETTRTRAIDPAVAARGLLQDASARLDHLLIIADANMTPAQRRVLEEAADDLKAAIRYLYL